jgi:hypothetical protein
MTKIAGQAMPFSVSSTPNLRTTPSDSSLSRGKLSPSVRASLAEIEGGSTETAATVA